MVPVHPHLPEEGAESDQAGVRERAEVAVGRGEQQVEREGGDDRAEKGAPRERLRMASDEPGWPVTNPDGQ